MHEEIRNCYTWHSATLVSDEAPSLCQTRDVFQTRLDLFYRELSKKINNETECALLSAVIGEIGNNCFDHNLGQWRDKPGCWFSHAFEDAAIWVALADRGQGVLSSLRRVDPTLKNDQDALEVAFHKKLSGRSPEQRGNGLKFVRNVINGHDNRALLFLSGKGKIRFGGLIPKEVDDLTRTQLIEKGQGTLALIFWNVVL